MGPDLRPVQNRQDGMGSRLWPDSHGQNRLERSHVETAHIQGLSFHPDVPGPCVRAGAAGDESAGPSVVLEALRPVETVPSPSWD